MPSSHSAFSSAKGWVVAHKAASALVIVALLSGIYGTVKAAGSPTSTDYVLGTVSTGDIVVTVSGSGQIAASNDVDVAAKGSGAITSLPVKVGDSVGDGQLLASIDPGDAAVQLKEAQLSYNELLASKSSSAQKSTDSVTQSQQSVASSYSSARSTILSTVASLTTSLDSLQNLLANGGYLAGADTAAFAESGHSATVASTQEATADVAAFANASEAVTAETDPSTLQSVMQQGVTAADSLAIAAKDAETTLDYLRQQTNNQNNSTDATNAYSSVTAVLTSANSALSNLQSAQQAITDAQTNLSEAQTSDAITSDTSSDVLSAQLNVEDKQQALDDFSVTAPFAGIVAKIDVQLGDTVSSGTTVATVLTKDKIANITLNEVDATNVHVGDKATLTFDAIDGLTLTGTVAEIDLVGTVTQGVVSYPVKITLDADDPRVTSGMTVNADIITDSAQDVMTVPSAAITTVGGTSYVKVVPDAEVAALASSTSATASAGVSLPTAPQSVAVTTGLTDGVNTQITSGLTEGETIVLRTQSAGATATKSAAAAATTRSIGPGAAGAARAGGGGGGGAAAFGATRAIGL